MGSLRGYFVVLAFGLSALAAAGIANVMIDPYLLYRSPRIEGFNLHKTRFFYGQYYAKPRLLEAVAPQHLVLGTSTAGGSLRPDHSGFRGERAFNYALAGSTPYLQSLALAQAMRVGELHSVIVCVDFFAYNAFMDQRAFRQFEQDVEPGDGLRVAWRRARRDIETRLARALHWNSLVSSLATVREQDEPGSNGEFRDIRSDGVWQNPRPVGWPQVRLFSTIERQYLSTGWFPEPARRFAFEDAHGRSTLSELRAILIAAKQVGAGVSVAIMPFHARYAEAMYAAGLWDEFDTLKRRIVALSVQPESGGDVRVWDFSGYHALSMDPVKGAAHDTPWFDDAIHPSTATGDRMLRRILQEPSGEAEFGRLLEPATLEASLAAAVRRRAEYQALNPADVAQVREIARQTAAARVPPAGVN